MSRAGELAGHTCLVAVYLLLNTGLNMTNRYVLGIYGFSFPMLLTMSHLCFSFIALAGPVMLKWTGSSVQRTSWKKQWRGLALVGTFMAMNIGLNNVSLVRLPLSLNQVLRYEPITRALIPNDSFWVQRVIAAFWLPRAVSSPDGDQRACP